MPYSKLSDAPANIRELDGVALTLAQVNWIANVADGLDPNEVENVWAVAIAQFKRSFVKRGGSWTKREREATKEEARVTERVGTLGRLLDMLSGDTKQQDFKTEDGVRYRRTDYAVQGEPETPTTWKLRLAEGSSGNFTVMQVARAITAMQPGGFRGRRVELGPGEKAEAVRNISRAISKVGDADQKENLRKRLAAVKAREELGGGFKVLEVEGKDYWVSRTTNAFQDGEDETFSTEALESYVKQVDEGLPQELKELLEKAGLPATEHGELWLAHIPGSKVGEPLWKAVEGRFLVEVGQFDETPLGQAAAKHFKEHGDDYRVSHGYLYHPEDRKEGVYRWLWKFETSPLPAGWESNPWTAFSVIAQEAKAMDEKKQTWLVETFGEELATSIITKAQEDSKSLEDLGITFKEKEEPSESETPEPYVLEEDSKAMELLAESVAEKLKKVWDDPVFVALKETITKLDGRIEAVEKADRPLVVLNRGFRASQAEETKVDEKQVPEEAKELKEASQHIIDQKMAQWTKLGGQP